jgi:hypothetical protein
MIAFLDPERADRRDVAESRAPVLAVLLRLLGQKTPDQSSLLVVNGHQAVRGDRPALTWAGS